MRILRIVLFQVDINLKFNCHFFAVSNQNNDHFDFIAYHKGILLSERAAEKMLTLEDNVPEQVVNSTRTRIRSLAEKSKGLAEKIEDELSCARKEHRRTLQSEPLN